MLRTLRGAHRHPGCACTQTIQRPRPSDYRAALAYHYLRSFPLQGRVDVGESACDMILHRGNRNPELFPNLSVGKLVNRSEEHTSELQSLMRISYAVFCLKKKKKITNTTTQ